MKIQPLAVAIGVFALALVAALFFQDAVRDVVVVPILYLVWFVGLLIRSFDQGCLWTIALVAALVLGVATIRRQPVERDVVPQPSARAKPTGRIQYWRNQVLASRASDIAQDSFRFEMRRLITELWSHRYHQPVDDVRRQLRQDQLPLPDVARSALGLKRLASPERVRWWERIGRWFAARLNRPGAAPSSPELNGTLDYLEDLMEVAHDTHPR